MNICVGESGDKLTRASKVLEQLSGQKVIQAKARYTLRGMLLLLLLLLKKKKWIHFNIIKLGFGIRRNEKIACHVTVRGEKAMEILERGSYKEKRKNLITNFIIYRIKSEGIRIKKTKFLRHWKLWFWNWRTHWFRFKVRSFYW